MLQPRVSLKEIIQIAQTNLFTLDLKFNLSFIIIIKINKSIKVALKLH